MLGESLYEDGQIVTAAIHNSGNIFGLHKSENKFGLHKTENNLAKLKK